MYLKVVGSVLGRRYVAEFMNERELATDEITRILRYYHVSPGRLPEAAGTTGEVLEHSIRPAGIMTRNVKLTEGWHLDASGAMLNTYTENGKPVALIPRDTS